MGELRAVRIPPPRSCSAAEAATVARSPRDPRPLQRDFAALPAEERGPFAPAALGPWALVTLAGPRDTAARALPRRRERGCCPRPRRAPREEQGRAPRGPLRPPCQRPRVAARAQPRGAEAGPGRWGQHGAADSRGRRSCRRVLSVALPVRGVARRTRDRPRWRKRRPPLAWLCARPCPLTGSRPPANPSRRVTAAAPAPAGGALRAQRSPPPPGLERWAPSGDCARGEEGSGPDGAPGRRSPPRARPAAVCGTRVTPLHPMSPTSAPRSQLLGA